MTYFNASETDKSYFPLIIGGMVFVSSLTLINYLAIQEPNTKIHIIKSLGYTAIISAIALYAFMFVLINTLGS